MGYEANSKEQLSTRRAKSHWTHDERRAPTIYHFSEERVALQFDSHQRSPTAEATLTTGLYKNLWPQKLLGVFVHTLKKNRIFSIWSSMMAVRLSPAGFSKQGSAYDLLPIYNYCYESISPILTILCTQSNIYYKNTKTYKIGC